MFQTESNRSYGPHPRRSFHRTIHSLPQIMQGRSRRPSAPTKTVPSVSRLLWASMSRSRRPNPRRMLVVEVEPCMLRLGVSRVHGVPGRVATYASLPCRLALNVHPVKAILRSRRGVRKLCAAWKSHRSTYCFRSSSSFGPYSLSRSMGSLGTSRAGPFTALNGCGGLDG
jgi:hypothetical protein